MDILIEAINEKNRETYRHLLPIAYFDREKIPGLAYGISISEADWTGPGACILFHVAGTELYIDYIMVDEEFRREGIGSILLGYIEEFALENGYTSARAECFTDDFDMSEFLKGLGYRPLALDMLNYRLRLKDREKVDINNGYGMVSVSEAETCIDLLRKHSPQYDRVNFMEYACEYSMFLTDSKTGKILAMFLCERRADDRIYLKNIKNTSGIEMKEVLAFVIACTERIKNDGYEYVFIDENVSFLPQLRERLELVSTTKFYKEIKKQ